MSLSAVLPSGRVSVKLIDRLAYAHDASMYRLVPVAVVRPKNENEVITLLKYARENSAPVTFRTAGTSLSGQAVTDGTVAEVVRDWKGFQILDEGRRIKLQPGVIGGHANSYLQPYGRKIGPDPASIDACMIGGIIANNSSGMICGVKNNAYNTMDSLRFILANGNSYDTSREEDFPRFFKDEKKLCEILLQCRQEIESTPWMKEKITGKYKIKNTIGYSLNAFLDYDQPLDIWSHLLVGSEGTLAFISEVILNTLPDPPEKSTGLILFDSIYAASKSIPFLIDEGAEAVEIMDYASLTTIKYRDNPLYDASILNPGHTALLCEFQSDSKEQVFSLTEKASKNMEKIGGKFLHEFTADDDKRTVLWKIRKGLYPTVGALRKSGTSLITEDICVHYTDMPEAVNNLGDIFRKWKYDDAVIFGHAKDGNLHFVCSVDLNSPEGTDRFAGLMDDLAGMTIGKFSGSLKAEHGTGRNMAAFVETEWGGDLYEIMWKIKQTADPQNILNPGVLLNRDKKLHLKNLKPLPAVNDEVDLCVECGFCESVCPSRSLTMTPRHRIAVAREIAMLREAHDPKVNEVLKDYHYAGDQTCAADGLCQTSCPVNINTGSYIKGLRELGYSPAKMGFADWCVDHFSFMQFSVRTALTKGKFFGDNIMHGFTGLMRKLSSNFPSWNSDFPEKATKIKPGAYGTGKPVIYFPSCVNRVFAAKGKNNMVQILEPIAEMAGVKLIIPDGIDSYCCGQPFSSKGFSNAGVRMTEKSLSMLSKASDKGQIPVLTDTSPCMLQFRDAQQDRSEIGLKFLDMITFLTDAVIISENESLDKKILIHPTCSNQKMKQESSLKKLAEMCTKSVELPEQLFCCGFAGDRGLTHPELTKSATNPTAHQWQELDKDIAGYSTSRTCEIGLTSGTGQQFNPIALLVLDFLNQNIKNAN